MPIDPIAENKSAHRLAFDHYLRTGQRLTTAQWLERAERKFNPYHDELGRFTSAPGVTVSWGAAAVARHSQSSEGSRVGRRPLQAGPRRSASGSPSHQDSSTPSAPRRVDAGFGSEFVRDRTSQAGNADTYFELNKRQAGLNRLREAAGPNPSAAVRADLDDFQARLDANRVLLEERAKVADREVGEILRAGLAPYNWAASGINIANGRGELRDYLAFADFIPFGGIASRLARAGIARAGTRAAAEVIDVATIPSRAVGGSHAQVVRARPPGFEANHIPPDSVNGLKYGEGPAIPMTIPHHRGTASWGSWISAKRHRKIQKELIEKGDFRGAQQMDIDDIRKKFGDTYDEYIEQMLKYSREKGYIE